MIIVKINKDSFLEVYVETMRKFIEETRSENESPEMHTLHVLMLSAFGGKLMSELFESEDK